jgi:uncharacterized protein with PIN domain
MIVKRKFSNFNNKKGALKMVLESIQLKGICPYCRKRIEKPPEIRPLSFYEKGKYISCPNCRKTIWLPFKQ